MISIPYHNDNPTPIRRKKAYLMGGNPDTVTAPINYSPDFKPVNEEESTDFNPDGTPIETEEDKAARNQKKQARNQVLLNGAKALPFAIDALASYSKQIDQNQQLRTQIMQQNRQKPIWDYNSMYGDNQPIIKAKNGAEVRTSSSPSAPFKIDNGEFLMLPDGKLEKAQGNSKKTDDISTILPQGTKIFSNTLKPNKSKDTFAKIALKHDYSKELEILENPYLAPVSRTSAERMLQRKQKNLNSLFEEQQALNGDSSGEMVANDEISEHKSGGWISKAVNPKHKGYCTPMTKSTCSGHRRALALTFKKHHGFHHEDGGDVEYAYGGELKTGRQPIPIADPYGPSNKIFDENGVQPISDFTYRNPKKLLDENGRMIYKDGGMITKYVNAGYVDPTPKYTFHTHKGDKNTKWNASEYTDAQLQQMATDLGYNGPDDIKSFQTWVLSKPELASRIQELHKQYGMPNAGKEVDGFLGKRWQFPTEKSAPIDMLAFDPEAFKKMTPSQQEEYIAAKGNQYGLSQKDMAKKTPYQKRNLPFSQAIPELSGFVSALNTYNYQTPDFQHWEISPNKLNVQPQLQSIDSSLKAITDTTTGNPQIDNARKVGAFTQALNAKQQVFANKQNYDSEKEFQATQYNISARTNEQNQDISAQNHIYNELMPLAKDYAAGERIAAISSLSTKYAKNTQNENEKALWIDNFYNNVEVDKDGNLKPMGSTTFDTPLYPEDTKAVALTKSTDANPIAIDGNNSSRFIAPIDMTPKDTLGEMQPIKHSSPSFGSNEPYNFNTSKKKPFYDPNSPIETSPVRITNKYGSLIKLRK